MLIRNSEIYFHKLGEIFYLLCDKFGEFEKNLSPTILVIFHDMGVTQPEINTFFFHCPFRSLTMSSVGRTQPNVKKYSLQNTMFNLVFINWLLIFFLLLNFDTSNLAVSY